MLANMTAGHPDYVRNPQFIEENNANPYRQWTSQELIDIGLSTPRIFDPGTNWDYSHTNIVILGRALDSGGSLLSLPRPSSASQDAVISGFGLAFETPRSLAWLFGLAFGAGFVAFPPAVPYMTRQSRHSEWRSDVRVGLLVPPHRVLRDTDGCDSPRVIQ